MGSAANFVKNKFSESGDSGEIIQRNKMESDVTSREHAHAMQFRREHDGEHLIAACHADDGGDDDGVLNEVGADPV